MSHLVYVTSDGGYCGIFPNMFAAFMHVRPRLLDQGHTVMVRTVYDDGLTHVIIDRSDARFGEWTYNNSGLPQEIYPDSGIPAPREE